MSLDKVRDDIAGLVKITHKLGNSVDIHVKQIHLVEQRVEMLDRHRENHAIQMNTMQIDQHHAAEFRKDITTSLDKLATKFENGFKDIVAEIAKLKESRSAWEGIINMIKPIVYMVLGGIGSYLMYIVMK